MPIVSAIASDNMSRDGMMLPITEMSEGALPDDDGTGGGTDPDPSFVVFL